MRIQLEDATNPVCFIVVDRLACPIRLGTQFLDHHVDAIKCKECVLYLTRSIIRILGIGDKTAPPQEPPPLSRTHAAKPETKPTDSAKRPKAARIRLCTSLCLPPFTQVKAQVITQRGGPVHTRTRYSPNNWRGYEARSALYYSSDGRGSTIDGYGNTTD